MLGIPVWFDRFLHVLQAVALKSESANASPCAQPEQSAGCPTTASSGTVRDEAAPGPSCGALCAQEVINISLEV